jgi:KaiC/GvpD/RAD55 family RecA-like ATPase/tetratricopeptide (TPR) repeat protein
VRRVSLQKELEPLLEKAKELEKRYNWLDAADFYEQAYSLVSEDFLKAAELQEQIGFCFYSAARQADTNGVFSDRMELAVKAYKKSSELLQSIEKNGKHAKISHVKALVAYASSCLERDRTKKGKLLGEWWRLENEALEEYEKDGDLINIGKTCNNLLHFSQEYRFWLPTDFQDIKRMMDELLNLGEKSIKVLSGLGDDYELARAYSYTGLYYSVGVWWIGDRVKEAKLKSIEYSQKALMHSEKIADFAIKAGAHETASMVQAIIVGNSVLAAEHNKKALKYAKITKDRGILASATCLSSTGIKMLSVLKEDPEKRSEGLQTSIEVGRESIDHFHKISLYGGPIFQTYKQIVISLKSLAQNATDIKSATEILDKAIEVGREAIKYTDGHIERRTAEAIGALMEALSNRAMVETNNSKKRRLLEESLEYCIKENEILERETPFINLYRISNQSNQVSIYAELAKTEQKKEKKIELLKRSLVPIENAIKLVAKDIKLHHLTWMSSVYGMFCYHFGGPLNELYILTKDVKVLSKSVEVYKSAVECYTIADTRSRVAEAYWQLATVNNRLGGSLESSHNYQLASDNYKLASEKIPQLKEFYDNYSLYMQAWSQIEQARHSNSIEDYDKAKEHYKKSAELHKKSDLWGYLALNYFAWANVEEAEGLSRKESTQQAKETFEKAYEMFCKAEESLKQKLEETSSPDEKEMMEQLLKASGLRQKYCQARRLMEEAKLLDREGKHLQSTKSYGNATQIISEIVSKIDTETERKELEYVALLCRAWEKMAVAQETSSAESYLEAVAFFEQAKDFCYTKKASLWVLGNINFCRGLAAGLAYQMNLDLAEHSKAKSYIKTAATNYMQAGFKNASEYAKATQRLFDAYLYINKAESESNQDVRAKQYQIVENLLQLAAGSFMKAKQPKKTTQVQEILVNVREEKALAISLSQVMQAPTVASSTLSFSAPTPTSEVSVGLESFEHANVQANLVAGLKEVKVGESFYLSVEFINAGKEPALLLQIDDFVPQGFVVVKKPEIYRLEESTLNMKGKQIMPLKLVEAKLVLQPLKKGQYQLNPKVHYLDELGYKKYLQLKTLEINVEEVILKDRVSTGTQELDSLLLGGIPNEYAVVLSGPPCDEREFLVKNFLKAGTKEEITFYIASEATGLESLLENPNFYLFLCNPKPKTQVPELPNVYRLQSKADITNLGIALTKAIRGISQSLTNKRICVAVLSDVLVKHGANTTREWISGLITDLGAKGFTTLAVMDPKEHPPDQATTVLNLFDGQINIIQSDDLLDCKKSILVKKLRNQDYIKNPICLR